MSSAASSTTAYSTFDSADWKATTINSFSLGHSDTSFNAYDVLRGLVNTLQEKKVPGPLLLRTSTEYNEELGKGGYATVLGANKDTIEKDRDVVKNRVPRRAVLAARVIAVKQHRSRGGEPATREQAQEFLGRHFKDAMREILVLTHKSLTSHPNIVKLQGWGLCLDALEDERMEQVNIPLLVLEKADGDLLRMLQDDKNSPRSRVSTKDRVKICADVGRGLQALHDIGISHGDLKTNNILIFRNQPGITAKICDFGTVNGFVVQGGKHSSYRGTERWRAPEVLPSSSSPPAGYSGLRLCDVYSYGLVVWAVFTNYGESPVLDESSAAIQEQAELDLQTYANTQPRTHEKNAYRLALEVVRECLPHDPFIRSLQPWQHFCTFDEQLATYISHKVQTTIQALFNFNFAELQLRMPIGRFANPTSMSKHLPSSAWLTTKLAQPLAAKEKIEVYATFASAVGFGDVVSEDRNQVYTNPNGLEQFCHPPAQCLDLPWLGELEVYLYELLLFVGTGLKSRLSDRFVDGRLKDLSVAELFYCFARFRSRLKLCCWNKINHRQHNFLSHYLQPENHGTFSTLAWLCRGEIGAAELKDPHIFLYLSKCLCSNRLDESRRLETFLLLLQSGFPIEKHSTGFLKPRYDYIKISGLLRFSRNFREASMRVVMRLICERFQSVAMQPQISEDTKHFMYCTGHVTTPSTFESLHQFAADLNYEAVEQLVRLGARVNHGFEEFDGHVQTPAMRARDVLPRNRKESLAQLRIINLLESFAKGTSPSQGHVAATTDKTPLKSDALPPGWSTQPVYRFLPSSTIVLVTKAIYSRLLHRFCLGLAHHEPETDTLFFEDFTGSITWRRPTFSLLSGGRVALGYRKFQGCYLDLIYFLTLRTPRIVAQDIGDRFPAINEEWYLKEPLTENRTDDPLGQLTESWTSSFTWTPSLRWPRLFTWPQASGPSAAYVVLLLYAVFMVGLLVVLWHVPRHTRS